MSDIHGCYDAMIKMLEQIAFTDEDMVPNYHRFLKGVFVESSKYGT